MFTYVIFCNTRPRKTSIVLLSALICPPMPFPVPLTPLSLLFMSLTSFVHLVLAVLVIIQEKICFWRLPDFQLHQFRCFIPTPPVCGCFICSDERLILTRCVCSSSYIPRPCPTGGASLCVLFRPLLAVQ